MNGRDLLCAFADIDEGMLVESGRFSVIEAAVESDRKKMRRRFAAVGIAAVVCIAVLAVMRSLPDPLPIFVPSDATETGILGSQDPSDNSGVAVLPGADATSESVSDEATSVQDVTSGTQPRIPSTVGPTTSSDPSKTKPQAPSTTDPTTEEPATVATTTEAPSNQTPSSAEPTTTEHSTTVIRPSPRLPSETETITEPNSEASSVTPTIAGEPIDPTVYEDLTVDYETAREIFGHPIRECEREDFVKYEALMVYPDGAENPEKYYCPVLYYVFIDGSVDLRDQDRTEGNVIIPASGAREYKGRTFYVHLPEFNGDRISVWYFPTGNSGICYQAFFDSRKDVNEIMEMIISIEI
ncbi:MAG: hypothetical protein IJM45_05205 [Clostridia bacterium]|nr:hypothetical protein [Clostridia bacterium]